MSVATYISLSGDNEKERPRFIKTYTDFELRKNSSE